MKVGDRLFLQGAFDKETLAFMRQMGADGVTINIAGELRGNAQGERAVDEALAQRLRSGPSWQAGRCSRPRSEAPPHSLSA